MSTRSPNRTLNEFFLKHQDLIDSPPKSRLSAALRAAAEDDDPEAYSLVLQTYLDAQEIPLVKGVFKVKLGPSERGRPALALRWKALCAALDLSEPSDGKIARRLLPEKFQKSPKQAKDHIRSLRLSAQKELLAYLRTGHSRYAGQIQEFYRALTNPPSTTRD